VIDVAFVIGRLNVGGAEAELVRIACGLDRTRFRPLVITLQDAGPLAGDLGDVEVLSINCCKAWPGTWRTLSRRLAERRPAIVQSFLFGENLLCRAIGKGIVVSGLQGSLSDACETAPSLRLSLDRATFDRATAVVSNSEYYRTLYGSLGFDARKIRVIRSGVAEPPAASGASVRAQFGIRDDELVVTCLARLVERKGHDDLIRAQSGLRLLFAGDGPYRRHLEGRGAILAGARRDVPEVLAASDIVALPSRFGEGCPNALLEAMAAGKPVVAARTGGIPEVVVDGETGLLVPREDPEALRTALQRLAADPALRARLGAAGRERVRREFSVPALVRSYEALYSELTASVPPI
jgi:glycosyltransferase involved in cell wall biosynthesis